MRKRILFLHKVFPWGGAEKVTIDTANYLSVHGYDVYVMTPDYHPEKAPSGVDFRFRVEEMPPCKLKHSQVAEKYVTAFIQEHKIDVLVSYRELLYIQRIKQTTGVKYVFVLHSMPGYEFVGSNPIVSMFNKWFYSMKYRRIFRQSDIYGVLCPQYKEKVERIVGIKPLADKIVVIPNYTENQDMVCLTKEKECLYVGRLSKRDKRVDRLLQIWAILEPQCPDWRLTIVGDGPDYSRLKALTEHLRLRNVTFAGHQQNVKAYYDRASFLCMTSSFEGWPMTVAEAQSNGVIPVLFNSFAGAESLVSNENEGVLIPPFDKERYASALLALMSDSERKNTMRQAVIDKAICYTIDRTGQIWQKLLSRLC